MYPRRRCRRAAVPAAAAALSLAASFALLLGGCRGRDAEGGGRSLGIPAPRKVRVIARRVAQTPDVVHWKWSLIGERNWRKPEAQEMGLSLSDTYPLNSTSERGGCNIWEVDVTVRRDGGAASAPVRWEAVLHGSNGDTARSGGTLDAGKSSGSLANTLHIRQDRDAVVRLPANLTLATLDGRPVTLRVAE